MKYSIITSPPHSHCHNYTSHLSVKPCHTVYRRWNFNLLDSVFHHYTKRKEFLKRRDSTFYRLFREYPHSNHIDSYPSENSIQWSLSRKRQKGIVTGDPKYRLSQRTFNRPNELETVIRSFRKCGHRRIWIGKVYQEQSRFFKRTCHQQSDQTGSKSWIRVCQCLVRPKQGISNCWQIRKKRHRPCRTKANNYSDYFYQPPKLAN